jgi:hypothetical protein
MSGSGVFDVSRVCDTVVMLARSTVGLNAVLDSRSTFRAERANSAIIEGVDVQWLGNY